MNFKHRYTHDPANASTDWIVTGPGVRVVVRDLSEARALTTAFQTAYDFGGFEYMEQLSNPEREKKEIAEKLIATIKEQLGIIDNE